MNTSYLKPLVFLAFSMILLPRDSFCQTISRSPSWHDKTVVLVPISQDPSWHDNVLLAAIPYAKKINKDEVLVLAVDEKDPWRPEVVDFLVRLKPEKLVWLGKSAPALSDKSLPTPRLISFTNAFKASEKIAEDGWIQSEMVVAYPIEEPVAALLAASLASRLGCPIFPLQNGKLKGAAKKIISGLKASTLIAIGNEVPRSTPDLKLIKLRDGLEVADWMVDNDMDIKYLAVVQPRGAKNRTLSFMASILAAQHQGIVVPIETETVWKKRFGADKEISRPPSGTEQSKDGWKMGTMDIGGKKRNFIIGQDTSSSRWWVQIDFNRDGKLKGKLEQPLTTGDKFTIQSDEWTVSLDASEAERGTAIWLTSPSARSIKESIQQYYQLSKYRADHLCLVGWPDALPMAVVNHGQGIDVDLISDLPYSQIDEDPFFELNFARFIAEDMPSATLQACRGFILDEFPAAPWQNQFATAEWEEGECQSLEEQGLDFHGHHQGGNPIEAGSPLTEAAIIIHGSHAWWLEMGKTYSWNTETLIAPAFVESAGCSTASLDQDVERRSVAARLLRNGAVAFSGNTRRGIAQYSLYRSELWNALLDGKTLGQAQRHAQNRVLVAVLEKDQGNGGLYYYQLYNQALFGDPAVSLHIPTLNATEKVHVEKKSNMVTLSAAGEWLQHAYAPNKEWGCESPTLYAWRMHGVGIENTWYHPEKRNAEDYMYTVEVAVNTRATSIKQIETVAPSLGWTGKCFIDNHFDGSKSLFWRVRLLDADTKSGEINARITELSFKVT